MFSALRAFIQKAVSEAHIGHQKNTDSPMSALIDAGTRVVLAVSENAAAITFLNESMMDTYHQLNVAWPNHLNGLPFPANMGSYAHWSFDIGSRRFERTRDDVLTPEVVEKSKLAVKKMNAVLFIMSRISTARTRLDTGILLQDSVYITKKMQAHAFRERKYDVRAIFEFPYVLQHADFADLSYREAAEDIILRSKLDDDLLAKTELLRMTYFAHLKRVTSGSQIQPLLEAFQREGFTNAYV